MKRILVVSIFLLSISSRAFAAPNSSDESVAHQIEKVNKSLLYGFMNRSVESLVQLAADDAIINDNGEKVSKADLKADFIRDSRKTEIKNIKVLGVTVQDEVAVVVGRLWGVPTDRKNYKYWINFTNIFVLRNKNWQLVSSYITPVEP